MKRALLAGIAFLALSACTPEEIATVQRAVTATATDHCPQHRSAFEGAGFTAAEWRTADRLMWNLTRCDMNKVNGRFYGALPIYVPADTSTPLFNGVPFKTACLPSGSPVDLRSAVWNAGCAKQIFDVYGWKAWNG